MGVCSNPRQGCELDAGVRDPKHRLVLLLLLLLLLPHPPPKLILMIGTSNTTIQL